MERIENAWTAINQVANEHGLTTDGRDDTADFSEVIAEGFEELYEFIETAVDVTDDVERAVIGLAVVPESLAFEGGRINLLRRFEDKNVAEAFAFETAKGAAELLGLLDDDVGGEIAVGAGTVALVAEILIDVEDDGDGQAVVFAGEFDEGLAGFLLDVGGVDDGEATGGEALGGDKVEDFEGVRGRRLVVFVIGDKGAAEVGG
jgi:hypothetical protein